MLNAITEYLSSISPVLAAFYASLFTWLITATGAALVFIFKGTNRTLLDAMLGFAAGAMIYVVIKEIIPEAQLNNNDISTLGFIGGFVMMMTLDVGLG